MADKKELEIGLKATGGAAAAKEIEKVEDAVVDLGKETTRAATAKPAEMVPAWDAVGTAVEEAGEATSETADATKELDKVMDDLRERLGGAREKIDDLTTAQGGATTGSDVLSGGVRGLGSRLLALAGGPIGIAVTAIGALVGWLAQIEARSKAAREAVSDLADGNRELSDRIAELDPAPIDELAEAGKRLAEAMHLADEKLGVSLAGIDRRKQEAGLAADAELRWRDAVLARQVAEGTKTREEAAREKGARAEEALAESAAAELEAATEKLLATDRAMQEALTALTYAQEQARQFVPASTEARDAASANRTGAVKKEREVSALEQDLERRGNRPYEFGGMSVRENLAATIKLETLEKEVAEMQQRGVELAKLAEEEAKQYREAVEDKLDQVKITTDHVDSIRKQQASAAEEVRAADQRAKLANTFGRATIQEGTKAELAGLAAAQKKKEEAEAARAEQEEQKRREKEAAANRTANRAAIDSDGQALAGEIMSKVSGADGDKNPALIASLKQIAALLGNGTNEGELTNITGQLVTLTDGLSAEQSASKAVVAQLKNQVDALLSRERNNQN